MDKIPIGKNPESDKIIKFRLCLRSDMANLPSWTDQLTLPVEHVGQFEWTFFS